MISSPSHNFSFLKKKIKIQEIAFLHHKYDSSKQRVSKLISQDAKKNLNVSSFIRRVLHLQPFRTRWRLDTSTISVD